MTRTLPPHPSIEQLKKQAKDLRKGHQSASAEAAERIKAYLPRLSEASAEDILQGEFSLQEAQHVIAGEYGCRHWEMLCAVVAGDLNILASLRDVHIQELLRAIDQEDFTKALNGAGPIVSWRMLSNMSLRVRTFISEEIEFKKDLPAEERLDGRRKILAKALELAAAGTIEWADDGDFSAIERSIEKVDFDVLAGLEDRGAQTLMRDIDQKDLVTALKGANEPVRERFLGNMSARVRGFLTSEMELSQATPEYGAEVQRRILVQAGCLAVRGMLQWPSGNGQTPAPEGPQYAVPESIGDLIARPLGQLTPHDMADLWSGIADQARKEGILSLQPTEEQAVDPFLREALQLAVDGTEPDLLRDILETRLTRAILPQQDTRCKMIVEAMMAIQSGDNPGIIRHKMATFYLASSDAMLDGDRPAEPTADELAERLRQTPVGELSFDQLADLLTDLGLLARNERIDAFGPLPSALGAWRDMASAVLRRGLEMLVSGDAPDEVMRTLESLAATWLDGLEKAHRMVIEGVMGTQAGKKPEEIAEAVRRAAA